MKNSSLKKLFAPSFVLASLFLGLQSQALQTQGSTERLFNYCQQELQAFCSSQLEPREAFMCLRDNEAQLFTRPCIKEMNLIERAYNNVPLPSEEPYRIPQENNEVQ